MTLFVLAETAAGFALFKAKDKKLLKRDNLAADIEKAEDICSLLQLKQFRKFDSAATALEEVSAIVEGKVTPLLSNLLDSVKDEKKVSLAVADPKLGNAINKLPSLELTPISDSKTADLYRSIRENLSSLIPGLAPSDVNTMALGLSHSLSRHKLKFSTDKVDTMIIQAIALLDDLDKELNMYAMRVKEWYGWHFPELSKILNDNLAYARVILKMGYRTNAAASDLTDILPEEIETAVKAAAEISMGTEITDDDLDNIKALAEQVVGFTEYRKQLSGYLTARMTAIAPNLTALVGELVGARLIAHAGSLMNLAKAPASTIQILGAEKALFRALKTKHDTPKYGLIFHASLIGQATGKNKGKIARMLATKAALGLRVDALSDWDADGDVKMEETPEEEKGAMGQEMRIKLERRLRALEGKPALPRGVAIAPSGKLGSTTGKWEIKEARKYNPDADGLLGDEPAAAVVVSKPPIREKIVKADQVKLIQELKKEDDDEEDGDMDSEEEEDDDEDDESVEERTEKEVGAVEAGKPITVVSLTKTKVKTSTPLPPTNGTATNGDAHSVTLSSVSDNTSDSPNSPTPQELNWQSPITGNTIVAKKARKKERHERKLSLSAERSEAKKKKNEKLARLQDRNERRLAKVAQEERRAERDIDKHAEAAAKAGLSVARYRRKLERGEISFAENGDPISISKKEIKKQKKAEAKEEKKKRKRADDGEGLDKREKKKKKKESLT